MRRSRPPSVSAIKSSSKPAVEATARARKGRPSGTAGAGADPLFNQSVAKAFAVLGAFSAEHRVRSLAEIADAAGMTNGSAQRCVHTLVELGYLKRTQRPAGWALAVRALGIGYPYLAGHAVLEQATTHLADLSHATGESVSLSEPDYPDMVYIARFPSHKRFFIHMPVGQRLPIYCTASGRAFLSALPRDEAQDLLERCERRKLTPHTQCDVRRILAIVDEAREVGVAWANQECYLGELTIAAPVLGPAGRPVAAVNLAGPTSRWALADLRRELAPMLIQTAQAASGRNRAGRRT